MSRKIYWLPLSLLLLTSCAGRINGPKSDPLPFLKKIPPLPKAAYTILSGKKLLGTLNIEIVPKGKNWIIRQNFHLGKTHIATNTALDSHFSLVSQEKKVQNDKRTLKVTTQIASKFGVIATEGKDREKVHLELPSLLYENDTLPLLLQFVDFSAWEKSGKKEKNAEVLQPQLAQVVPIKITLQKKRGQLYHITFLVNKKKAEAAYRDKPPHWLQHLSIPPYAFHRVSAQGGKHDPD